MARSTTKYVCSACQNVETRWFGRCPQCSAYGTLNETAPQVNNSAGLKWSGNAKSPHKKAQRVDEAHREEVVSRISTGLEELDRVLGGGLVPGQVVLLAGPPGIGKSTILLSVADAISKATKKDVLYISGEESAQQIAGRAKRIGAGNPHLFISDDTELEVALGHIQEHSPNLGLAILDSLQAIASSSVDGRVGNTAQVQEVAHAFVRTAKNQNIPAILVGQVTKDSQVAGPNSVVHLVDAVLDVSSEESTGLRIIRATKNRYGPAGVGSSEIAAFQQTDRGMVEVKDPSNLFREVRSTPVVGTCTTTFIEGSRALLTEIQALAATTSNPNPRRGFSGLENARTSMLVAVTERAGRLKLYDKDVYVATVGGMKISDPSTDIATCLALAAAAWDAALPLDVAAIGEVALSGDLRPARFAENRIRELYRAGFRKIIIPESRSISAESLGLEGLTLFPSQNIAWALNLLKQFNVTPQQT